MVLVLQATPCRSKSGSQEAGLLEHGVAKLILEFRWGSIDSVLVLGVSLSTLLTLYRVGFFPGEISSKESGSSSILSECPEGGNVSSEVTSESRL